MNSESQALSIRNISKKFSYHLKSQMFYGFGDIIKNILNIPLVGSLRKDEFFAVNDVSFDVKKGEAIGLIGLNGSGKSTILKMINGIFMPDSGEIRIHGRVGALIEVGAGFHPYLTGKENIYLNGAILGMKKKEIDEVFDEIVEFAEVREFLDTPVKNYSSGMYVRLGFSIASHVKADILLIDEILAVGDYEFQQKCFDKINQLKKSGVTIVLVNHNDENVKKVCDRCILLHKGKIENVGGVDLIMDEYHKKS
jgi:lipopolysaccharide transport system ATP-binding protein